MKRLLALLFLFSCSYVCKAEEQPVVSLTAGWIYLSAAQQDAGRAALHGWYLIPQYHLNRRWSLIAEFDNLYGSPNRVSTNVHAYIGGVLYGRAAGKRLFPFTFSEAGVVRTSAAGNITQNFIFVAGIGMNVKLAKHFYLQLIPADYILTTQPGGPFHNYAAQAGIVFDIWSK